MNKQHQAGFTWIECLMAVVILAVMAAVALPKIADASTSDTASVAGALSSASAINYSSRKVDGSKGHAVGNCADVAAALQGGLPSGYAIVGNAVSADVTMACELTGPAATKANFTATGVL